MIKIVVAFIVGFYLGGLLEFNTKTSYAREHKPPTTCPKYPPSKMNKGD